MFLDSGRPRLYYRFVIYRFLPLLHWHLHGYIRMEGCGIIYRAERLFDGLSRELKIKMETERAKTGFTTGNLSLILEKEFPKVLKSVKEKCLKQLAGEMEIDLGPEGNYMFYPTKVYKQPGKDRRFRKP